MNETNKRPGLTDTAGQMALPLGGLWIASFLCTMYSADYPSLSLPGLLLGVLSPSFVYSRLAAYRRHHPQTGWFYMLRLALMTGLLAGLLTDAAQYLYFAALDGGRLLSQLGTAMQSEEYRQMWQQLMPEVSLEEMQKMVQQMTVRDIVIQLATYNAFLALPVALIAALPLALSPKRQ